jgi:TPR repeat protein
MRCFLCKTLYHGAIVCLDCNSGYCGFECMHADKMHKYQCKIIQAPVDCGFCLNPITSIGQGYATECGHGMHATCAGFCELYGLNGCLQCDSSNELVRVARQMLFLYARVCFNAVHLNVRRPDAPAQLLDFLNRAGDHTSELLYMRGNIYANGLGVPQDDELAYKIMSRAAVLGNGCAMFAVSGNNEKKMVVAAKRGSSHACCELAQKDSLWLLKALEITPFDLDARFNLAAHYESLTQRDDAVIQYYMLARQGHEGSMERLARLFLDMATEGDALKLIPSLFWATRAPSSVKALKIKALIALKLDLNDLAFDCISEAAESPEPAGIDATYELSRLHLLGVGTPVNEVKSEVLLEKAAAAGQSSAQFDLAMIRFESDKTEAFRLVRAAAKTHAVAMHFLSHYDTDFGLLEKAGTMIPSALYDLAIRYVRLAEEENLELNYTKAAQLLERALAMKAPLFECCELDVARTTSFLENLREILAKCTQMHLANMDNIMRLAQCTLSPFLFELIESKW